MKKSRKNPRKNAYRNDYYTQLAKKNNLLARSYFKLEQIEKRFSLIQKNQRILELGAAHGAWSKYLCEKTNGHISLSAVDRRPMPAPEPKPHSFVFQQKDVFKLARQDFSENYHGILSDMAPDTSGIKDKDSYESYELLVKALDIASACLMSGGFVVFKYFQGSEMPELLKEMRLVFEKVHIFKPSASRSVSYEVYLIGQNFTRLEKEISK